AEPIPDCCEVRKDQVHARLVGLREEHPAVDDQQPTRVLEDGHISTDLPEAAERDHPQTLVSERRRRREVGMRMAHTASSNPAAAQSARKTAICSAVASTSGSRTGPAGRPSSPTAAFVMI